jgi:hypothetical protein
MPTIVFEAKDGSGRDLTAVAVTMDGLPFVDKLDGSALAVDPGDHVFSFEAAGQPKVDKHFVVYEGERGRREQVTIGERASSPAAPDRELQQTPPPSHALATRRTVGLLLGAVGIVGLGVGSVFGLETFSAWSRVKDACGEGGASHCRASDPSTVLSNRSTAQTDATLATGAFAIGGLLLAGGAALFFFGERAEAGAKPGLSMVPAAGPGLSGFALRGGF